MLSYAEVFFIVAPVYRMYVCRMVFLIFSAAILMFNSKPTSKVFKIVNNFEDLLGLVCVHSVLKR